MFGPFFRGLSFGASLIVAIGAQNAFVIRHALAKEHLFLTAILCSTIDAALILLGVFGFGAVIAEFPLLLIFAKYFAIAFLIGYGFLAMRAALKNTETTIVKIDKNVSKKKTLLSILAFSLLNPHVYLDTVILLGSIAAQEEPAMQIFFALGAIFASFIWFFSISYGAYFCARWLSKPKMQKGIDLVIALTMWSIAVKLSIN